MAIIIGGQRASSAFKLVKW